MPPSIKLRFTLLLSLLLGAFGATLLLVRHLERTERAAMIATDRQARAQLLNHWIEAASRELPQYAGDLAQSEEFAALISGPETAETRGKIVASLTDANAAAVWAVREDGSVIRGISPRDDVMLALPLTAPEFALLVAETPAPRFFAENGAELFEISVRRIQAGAAAGRDWLVVARAWDDAHLRTLAALTEGAVSLRPALELARAPDSDTRLALVRPLTDWRGRTLRLLRVDYEVPAIDQAVASDWRHALAFIAFGVLVLAAMGLALHAWVVRPLGRIRESLAADDAAAVAPLTTDRGEFGRVANLVVSSFSQRDALQREIEERKRTEEALARSEAGLRENMEERARLGRDLHDGVIQSLYAAGMGLAGIRSQLLPDQTEAAARLEQTRGVLNETIHDVRNFIVGLEPEALRQQTFSQAVSALLEAMHGMKQFKSSLDLDDELAARLTLAQRVHALQITREAVSNALRHGDAGSIQVRLRRSGEFAEFEVVDNGRGFDATSAVSHGRGLGNFAQRARELGAELTVQSRPGHGTSVRLTFSLSL